MTLEMHKSKMVSTNTIIHFSLSQYTHRVQISQTGNVKGTTALGNSLAVSSKVNYTPIIWPSHFTSRYLPQRKKKSVSIQTQMFITAFLIFSIAKYGTQMFINRWMDEQPVVYNRKLLNSKKEWSIDTQNNIDRSQNNDADWTKSEIEYVLYNPIYIVLKLKPIYSAASRSMIVWDEAWGAQARGTNGQQDTLGSMCSLPSLWFHRDTHTQNLKFHTFNKCSWFCVDYTSLTLKITSHILKKSYSNTPSHDLYAFIKSNI